MISQMFMSKQEREHLIRREREALEREQQIIQLGSREAKQAGVSFATYERAS
jgi:hypothetical protein